MPASSTREPGFAAAEQKLRGALARDPTDAEAANQLGLVFARQNRSDEARHWLKQAIASKRDYADAINNLGIVYAQDGSLNDALATFQYGLQVAPDARDLYVNLARLHVTMGNFDRAATCSSAFWPGSPMIRWCVAPSKS